MQRTTTAIRTTILTTLLVTIATALLGSGLAQIELTEFESGTPIVADEMNENFDELKTAVEAVAHGSVHVSPLDLVPLDGATNYVVRSKYAHLDLDEDLSHTCFGANVDVPQGSVITSVGATADTSQSSTPASAAEVSFGFREWNAQPTTYYEMIDQFGSSTGYVDASVSGPFTDHAAATSVDNASYEYKVLVCLEGDAHFYDAQVDYQLP